jgi:integrase
MRHRQHRRRQEVTDRQPGRHDNPAATASPPSARQARAPEMHPWDAAQLAAFLGWSAEKSGQHAAWTLLAMTGMRRGEVLALRWRDVALDAATVSVRRSAGVVRVKGEGRDHRRGRHEERQAAGDRP